MSVGVGLALIVVAAFHLIPAATSGTIPTTTRGKPIRREERPTEFWITTTVFTAAAITGFVMIVVALLS